MLSNKYTIGTYFIGVNIVKWGAFLTTSSETGFLLPMENFRLSLASVREECFQVCMLPEMLTLFTQKIYMCFVLFHTQCQIFSLPQQLALKLSPCIKKLAVQTFAQ